jgi:hypothetical protein
MTGRQHVEMKRKNVLDKKHIVSSSQRGRERLVQAGEENKFNVLVDLHVEWSSDEK